MLRVCKSVCCVCVEVHADCVWVIGAYCVRMCDE